MSFWIPIYLGNLYIYMYIYRPFFHRRFGHAMDGSEFSKGIRSPKWPKNIQVKLRIYFINCLGSIREKFLGELTGTSPPILAKLLILFFLFSKVTNLKSPKNIFREQESATDGTKFAGSSSQGLAA